MRVKCELSASYSSYKRVGYRVIKLAFTRKVRVLRVYCYSLKII